MSSERSGTLQQDNLRRSVRSIALFIISFQLTHHFLDISDNIKDIRLPETPEGKKAAIAYIELDNETSYEVNFIIFIFLYQ